MELNFSDCSANEYFRQGNESYIGECNFFIKREKCQLNSQFLMQKSVTLPDEWQGQRRVRFLVEGAAL